MAETGKKQIKKTISMVCLDWKWNLGGGVLFKKEMPKRKRQWQSPVTVCNAPWWHVFCLDEEGKAAKTMTAACMLMLIGRNTLQEQMYLEKYRKHCGREWLLPHREGVASLGHKLLSPCRQSDAGVRFPRTQVGARCGFQQRKEEGFINEKK